MTVYDEQTAIGTGTDENQNEHVFSFGITIDELYTLRGLTRLDGLFLEHLKQSAAGLWERLQACRTDPDALGSKQESVLLVALAPHVQDFVGVLFGISADIVALTSKYHALAPLYACKRLFVQRRALKAIREAEAQTLDGTALLAEMETLLGEAFTELTFACAVMTWLDNEQENTHQLEMAMRYAAWRGYADSAERRESSILFRVPRKIDPLNLVQTATETHMGLDCLRLPLCRPLRRRDGFALTDPGFSREQALDEANYCIFCHNQGKDSCAKGMRDQKTGEWRRNALGRYIVGCPLEEHISEFQALMTHGDVVAALAMITVANPMAAGTGHRICNDCMVGCIYNNQNRTAVNIPQVETRVVRDVLALPYGFEVYSLLTRWNPLNLRSYLPKAVSGKNVLVVGLGPAGYTLAHHLLNDGHTVVAVDGLKLEPLAQELSGVEKTGTRVPFQPIRDVTELWEPLATRTMAGFGGVAEYGITVRWDKNFLKIIRLLLERRTHFSLFGGVRMGGTLTPDFAFAMGFHHIALCLGAGQPTIVPMENGLARGVRQASDFLMSIQLTGAAKENSIANLQIRLPCIVIGGGLTAIDASTEALAYYPLQVEKFLARYEILVAEKGESAVRTAFNAEETLIAEEFLRHAYALRVERTTAAAEGRVPRLWELLDQWGGSTIVYRRSLRESPAYRNNPEEVLKALEEGVRFSEKLVPLKVELDPFGHAKGLRLRDDTGVERVIAARTILVAAGTVPNTTLASEVAGFNLNGKYFQAVDEDGQPVSSERLAKPAVAHVLTIVHDDCRAVSFFGDQHPSFAGNVVSAMASARQGYPVVSRMLARCPKAGSSGSVIPLMTRLNALLRPVVHTVKRLTPTIMEVAVRAPLAARMFRPGQFYRLQNYETLARTVDSTSLTMEGVALTGAWVDPVNGILSMIVLEVGGSSDLVSQLREGEPVIVMGPTGTPTEIPPSGSTVLLAGGGLGNAVLFAIGRMLRAKGIRVLYFAGYKAIADRYKVDEITAAADLVVWCCDESPGFTPDRPQDKVFVGTIIAAMHAYAEGRLGLTSIPLDQVDRIIAIGSDRMMDAVRATRYGVLATYLTRTPTAIGSINSPMQCMMKGICAQCLQVHRDPESGRETVVFSCSNQDQLLDTVDFSSLHQRLSQQSTQEKLTRMWIDRCLVKGGYREHARF
ncbi:Glutamate synthase [NADPH] small chain [invertebrate metagenome]|uniref:Glutamate synthase [NADPH] small chain n=1 Tax=invertebrate metagenome TaxID=1711999 RepID=A0A484H8P0_9ZZZZ